MEADPKEYRPRPPGRRYYAVWTAAVVVVLMLTGGMVLARSGRLERQSAALSSELAKGVRVLVTPAGGTRRSREVEIPATVRGFIETPVYAKVAGYLKTIRVDKGDRVRAGEVIAEIEAPELDHQVANAAAASRLAEVTDRRDQALLHEHVISAQMADEAHAQLLEAEAALKELRALQEYKLIRAPFAGVVTARYVDPGHLIPQQTAPSASSAPIVSIATLSPVRIYAELPQSAALLIRDGDPALVSVTEYPGRKFEGSISRHPQALTSATRTMLVEVDLPNADVALLPGMYATMKVKVEAPAGAPTVPDDALIFRDGRPYVPLVRDGRLKIAGVTLGYDDGVEIQITDGVRAGDLVALNVGQAAYDGEPVRPVTAAELQK